MKYSPDEKYEIIRMVEQSDLGVERTLKKIGIPKSSFYLWYHQYLEHGIDGLKAAIATAAASLEPDQR
jgi:putative transposase